MTEALASVIKTYPGWTMFCFVIITLAIAHRIKNWRR